MGRSSVLLEVHGTDRCIQDEVLASKKICSKISRDVRRFWLKINKVVAFKQKLDADEVRQKVSCGGCLSAVLRLFA